ncbi:hypothetical protein BH11BAC1_BH11BAC1_25270 [soil metagenome]
MRNKLVFFHRSLIAGRIIFILSCFYFQATYAQPGEWVWLHGSSTSNSAGNFGVQGISSPTNVPPATYESCEWTDLNGNFWLFGGLNSSYNSYGDLWKYDLSTNEWVWKKGTGIIGDPGNYGIMGVSSASNNPPSKGWGIASWVDNQGNFWMYGGSGSGGVFADLWKYDIVTNEWTWMKGPSGAGGAGVYGTQGVPDPANNPGKRFECATAWTDNAGDLWLFGGYSVTGFNDLWRFNIATNNWTWMKGSPGGSVPGVYGTQGVEAPLNTPGSRQVYTHWKDNIGNLWLFGGYDYVNGTIFNDLWRFNPVTNNWAWIMGGSGSGVYNNQCQSDSANIPGGRFENRAVAVDQNGDFWTFGGGVGNSFQDIFNDLWKYCVSTGQWTWISGDNIPNPTGNWGTLGVSSPLNKPNGRGGSLMWSDTNGGLYFFGGTDENWPNPYNDFWKFNIDPACGACNTMPQAIFTAPNHICPGTCTDFTNLSVNASSFQWNFSGANPSFSTDVNPANICYNTPGNYSVSLIATNATGSDTITLNNFITVYPYPAPQGIAQNGDTLFANAGAISYQWYHNGNIIPGATDYFYVAIESGDYNIVATDANGCEVEAAIFDVLASLTPALSAVVRVTTYPNPAEDLLSIQNVNPDMNHLEVNSISIYNSHGEMCIAVCLPIDKCRLPVEADVSGLSTGLYYIEIMFSEKTFRNKFIKN